MRLSHRLFYQGYIYRHSYSCLASINEKMLRRSVWVWKIEDKGFVWRRNP